MTTETPLTPRRSQRLKVSGSYVDSPVVRNLGQTFVNETLVSQISALENSKSESCALKQEQPDDEILSKVSIIRHPITTMSLFFRFLWKEKGIIVRLPRPVAFSLFYMGIFFLMVEYSKKHPGIHISWIVAFEDNFTWYLRWFVLGVLSSIGLGTGAHTFLLFLGPMIAETTTAAFTCMSTNFALFGPHR
jgi:hypothetical protein